MNKLITVFTHNANWQLCEVIDLDTTLVHQLGYSRDTNQEVVVSAHARHPLSRNSTVSYTDVPALAYAEQLHNSYDTKRYTNQKHTEVGEFIDSMNRAMAEKLDVMTKQVKEMPSITEVDLE